MQGVRLPDGEAPKNAGEYAYMPYALWEYQPPFFLGDGEWHLIAPDGTVGAAGRHWIETLDDGQQVEHPPAHTVQIHDDGSATFAPSLVMPSKWHGYLERGVWRGC